MVLRGGSQLMSKPFFCWRHVTFRGGFGLGPGGRWEYLVINRIIWSYGPIYSQTSLNRITLIRIPLYPDSGLWGQTVLAYITQWPVNPGDPKSGRLYGGQTNEDWLYINHQTVNKNFECNFGYHYHFDYIAIFVLYNIMHNSFELVSLIEENPLWMSNY